MNNFSRLSLLVGFALLAVSAKASIISNFDNSASGSLGTIDLVNGGPALLVQGTANGGALLNFTGLENLITVGGGQSRVEGADGSFTDLDIRFANGNLFARIVFNLDAQADGFVTVTAYDQFLNPYVLAALALDDNGQNFINVEASGIHLLSSVKFTTTVGLDDIAQVRVNNIVGTSISTTSVTVPEPATFGLVGATLAGLALVRRRRSNRR